MIAWAAVVATVVAAVDARNQQRLGPAADLGADSFWAVDHPAARWDQNVRWLMIWAAGAETEGEQRLVGGDDAAS